MPYHTWLCPPPCCVAGCDCVYWNGAGNADLALIMEDSEMLLGWAERAPEFWIPLSAAVDQDDIEIYPEFGADLERLLADAPRGSFGVLRGGAGHAVVLMTLAHGACMHSTTGWFVQAGAFCRCCRLARRCLCCRSAFSIMTGSFPSSIDFSEGILQLASAGALFQARERQFYGTGHLGETGSGTASLP